MKETVLDQDHPMVEVEELVEDLGVDHDLGVEETRENFLTEKEILLL